MKVVIVIPVYGIIDSNLLLNLVKIRDDIAHYNFTNDIYDVVLAYDEDNIKSLDILKKFKFNLFPYSKTRFKASHFHTLDTPYKFSLDVLPEWTSDMWYYNCQYILPYFYLNNMGYDKYWYMENDVFFSGNYFEYFNAFSNKDYDFMTCGKQDNPITDGPVEDRTFLKTLTFNNDELYSALNTLHMFTNNALHTLIGYYWTGNDMYFELFYVSLMKKAGYKIGDTLNEIVRFSPRKFEDGNVRLTFRNLNISLTYDEVIYANTLYHPIKDFSIVYAPWKNYSKCKTSKLNNIDVKVNGNIIEVKENEE